MEIKTTRNGPFSIRLMHPLHGVKQPTRLYELTFLPLPLPSPLSHYSPQIKFHEWIRCISKFGRDIFHIYIYIYQLGISQTAFTNFRLDPFFRLSLFPSRTLSRNKYKKRRSSGNRIFLGIERKVSRGSEARRK